ncbi:MAG: hypothetical protein F7C35_00025 [Desulfurococcales archaeon]|nr:hypothetical protein [Desulfurococcales archaeon]
MGKVVFRVVDIDGYGHRVYPSEGEPWDKKLAEAVELLARASYALSRELGKPIGTVKIDWGDSTAIVKVGRGKVIGVIVEEQAGPPASKASSYGLAEA